MKVADLLESRREQWRELEQLCARMNHWRRKRMPAADILQFSSLYRAACADLALADAYQLPPATVEYLHQLVGRAHNQLYRGEALTFRTWFHELFVVVPRRLFGRPLSVAGDRRFSGGCSCCRPLWPTARRASPNGCSARSR